MDSYPEYYGRSLFLGLKQGQDWRLERAEGEKFLARIEKSREAVDDSDSDDASPESIETRLQEELEFLNDGLFCEWVYVLDLDDDVLEVYKGDSLNKTEGHRFAAVGNDEATVPAMVGRFNAEAIAALSDKDFVDEVLNNCPGSDDD